MTWTPRPSRPSPDFASETGLPGKYVRIAARYQQDGTLVATRIWASSSFNSVWLSPEGHVLHANTTNQTITVSNESGVRAADAVDANTQFYLRQPWSAVADATPIGTGTAFLDRTTWCAASRFTPAWSIRWPTPLVAQSIDIETADLLRRHLGSQPRAASPIRTTTCAPAMTTWSRSTTSPPPAPTAPMQRQCRHRLRVLELRLSDAGRSGGTASATSLRHRRQ